jgi:carboxypeptidase C (cathepsin A)
MLRPARLSAVLLLALSLAAPSFAQAPDADRGQGERQEQAARPDSGRRNGEAEARQERSGPRSGSESRQLPPESITHHSVSLPGRTLNFTAKVGALTLVDQQGRPQAEYGYVAYILDGAEPGSRPVTFAINGGPGAASAYLNLLAIGPWRLPVDEASISPSAAPVLEPNAQTWLDFTDLVFIDPPGTGYAQVVGGDEAKQHFYSVEGDADGIAAFVTRWLKRNDRVASPKFFTGESYGGFRTPLVAKKLQDDQGIGLSGLVMISPVLDFAWFSQPSYAPWVHVTRLPSMAAAAREAKGEVTRENLKDVELFASGDYLTGLMRGLQDPDALDRISSQVAAFTGLDPALVRRLGARIEPGAFTREALRPERRVLSAYDTGVSGYDPNPEAYQSRFQDPVLDALTAPLTSAVLDLLGRTLNYRVEGRRYELLNGQVTGAWRYGRGRGQPESMSELRAVLALDPNLRALVAHGFTDLVTPYYGSQLLLDQLPDLGPKRRIALDVYEGGHMFYSRNGSREAFRRDVKQLYDDALAARANGGARE